MVLFISVSFSRTLDLDQDFSEIARGLDRRQCSFSGGVLSHLLWESWTAAFMRAAIHIFIIIFISSCTFIYLKLNAFGLNIWAGSWDSSFTDVFSNNVGLRTSPMNQCLLTGSCCFTLGIVLYYHLCQENWLSDHGLTKIIQMVWTEKRTSYFLTESQNDRGWKQPLEFAWSNSTVQAGTPRASCSGPCPHGFSISPRMESPQTPRATCSSANFLNS